MYICICNAVTDLDINQAVENGADHVRQLEARLGAGTNCGTCICELERCLDTALASRPAKLDLAAC